MSEANKNIVTRWFEEVWNNGRAETIDELLAPDATIHGLEDPSGAAVKGSQEFREFYAQFRGAMPDIRVVTEDVIGEGDRVAARCHVRAKHTGEHLGFAATGADVAFDGLVMIRVENGKIQEAWNYFDFNKMNRQLGL